MNIRLPDVVARYFEASARRDRDAVGAAFADDAVVADEGHTWRGAAEIRAWLEGTASQYEYTTELLGAQAEGEDAVTVTGRIDGDFPGGTAQLDWHFTLAGGLIRHLRIAP
ncbi:SnoaL-like domain-containing protein [Nonomuraea maritima]|uniref:SnoaL-like domain-containing protein n=1 Tax=Nonomuraea maritima TaxID=683260 RepID=A0A1G8Y0X4_9ACTN|nr:nuclear transport factor 2 family protein [Nonomuraea maritima]SDJ96432.1 SnoaL-like domain-containing protein [Nonomuraea maritima]